MPQKSRLREDAFSWVQDTSQPVEKPKPTAKPKPVAIEKAIPFAPVGQQRVILVKYYNRADGEISDILEKKAEGGFEVAWSEVPTTQAVSQFTLTGELANLELIAIHKGFRVDISGQVPTLVSR